MVAYMKEQIIEFPTLPPEMLDGPVDPHDGCCVTYQYDIDAHGYGPYGFRTERINKILKESFPSLIYWDANQAKLVDADTPLVAGVYFSKSQEYVCEAELSLRNYEKAYKLWVLRSRYNKNRHDNNAPPKPNLMKITTDRIIPSACINYFIQQKCEFFIIYSLFPYGGQSLALFDKSLSLRLRLLAERELVPYRVVNSDDELKPW